MSSWESEGVDDHEGDEEQSQWSFPILSPYYLFLIVVVTVLIRNLKSCSPSMFCLYFALKSRHPEGHITQEETDIASGKSPLTAEASAEFLSSLEVQSENIRDAFAKQQEQATVCRYCASTLTFN